MRRTLTVKNVLEVTSKVTSFRVRLQWWIHQGFIGGRVLDEKPSTKPMNRALLGIIHSKKSHNLFRAVDNSIEQCFTANIISVLSTILFSIVEPDLAYDQV